MSLLRNKTTLILILAFTLSSSAGIAGMHTDEMGNMTGCPFMGMDSICQMGPLGHIGAFQSMFTGLPTKHTLFAILLFVFLVVSLATIPKINSPPDTFIFFIKEAFRSPVPNRILVALSDGIIQPKLYA